MDFDSMEEQENKGKKGKYISSSRRVLDMALQLIHGEEITFDGWSDRYQKADPGKKIESIRRNFQRDLDDIRDQLTVNQFNAEIIKKDKVFTLIGTETESSLSDSIVIAQILIGSRAVSKRALETLLTSLAQRLAPKFKAQFYAHIKTAKDSYIPLKRDETKELNESLLEKIDIIIRAINEHRRVKFNYQSSHSRGRREHTVQPEVMFFDNAYFYIAVRNSVKHEYWLYRLDRMTDITSGNVGNTQWSPDQFSLHDYRQQTNLLQQGELVTFEFKCRIYPQTALDRFPDSKIVSKPGDKDTIIRARSWDEGAILWLLGQGANVQVISPDKLVNKIKTRLNEAARLYD